MEMHRILAGMSTAYFIERTMASDRGTDDAREGKPMDQRMRSRYKAVPAWNDAFWAAYQEAYRAEQEG
jgi:hypothetical protein